MNVYRSRYLRILFVPFLLCVFFSHDPVHAQDRTQAIDPVEQCAEGVRLFLAYENDDALPLLETGFSHRDEATFSNPNDLGYCAMALGKLHMDAGEYQEAIDPYLVSEEIFKESGHKEGELTSLGTLAHLYSELAQYDLEIDYLQQAIIISRELNDRETEFGLLDALGLSHIHRGDYDLSFDPYKQMLEIARELDDPGREVIALNNTGLAYLYQEQYIKSQEQYKKSLAISQQIGDRAGEADILNMLGMVSNENKDPAGGRDYFQQSLTIYGELSDEAGKAKVLNNIAWLLQNQAEYQEALEYYELAIASYRKAGNSRGEGEALNSISHMYELQGLYAEAITYQEEALSIFQSLGYREREAGTLDSIGFYYYKQDMYDEALEYYQQAIQIMEEVNDLAGKGYTLNHIGVVYAKQGRYTEALDFYEQSLAIMREIDDRAGIGTELQVIGLAYADQGQYAVALEYYQQSLTISREVGNRKTEAITLGNIGVVYASQGQYERALEAYEQALAIQQEIGDREGEGATQTNIGLILGNQQQYAEALDYYERALAARRQAGDRAGEGMTLNNIGALYENRGEAETALDYYQQALEIAREVGDRSSEGTTLNNIGEAYLSLGKYPQGLEFLQQALPILHEVGDRAVEGTALSNIGSGYQLQGENSKALEYFEQSIDIFESLRATAGSDLARSTFIAEHSNSYDIMIDLYLQESQYEQAFKISERGRARGFLDSLATGRVELSDNEASDLYDREQETYMIRQNVEDALRRAKAQIPTDPKLIEGLETQLNQAEGDYQSALKAIAARGDNLEQLIPGRSSVLDIKEIQEYLDDETALLSFWVADEKTMVFVLTRDSLDVVELPISSENLHKQIEAFRSFSNTDSAHPDSAVQLYKSIIAPLKPFLTRLRLILIPHQELHYLPFAALTDGTRYLVDDFSISYLPSASAFPYIAKNAEGNNDTLLALGNPETSFPDLKPLPYAENESRTIAALYQTSALLGSDATETALYAQSSQAGIVHLAAHGSYNSADPMYSTLYLAPDAEHDGSLETHEIYKLNLAQTDLVVLSACQTQIGNLSSGDELVGLTRAFMFAGAPTVISSLWEVDDAATEHLMEKFYTNWRGGMSKEEALRQAQIEVRSEYPNPYYWAGFVLNGDGGGETPTTLPPTQNPSAIPNCFGGISTSFLLAIVGLTKIRKPRWPA